MKLQILSIVAAAAFLAGFVLRVRASETCNDS